MAKLPKVDPVESDQVSPEQKETVERTGLENKRFYDLWSRLKQNESSGEAAGTLKSLEVNLMNKDFLFYFSQKLKELPIDPANADDLFDFFKKTSKQFSKKMRRIR